MYPVKIKNSEVNLAPPPGVSIEECGTLHVKQIKDDRFLGLQSAWRPTRAELKMLNNNGCVLLTVFAGTHPMIAMQAGSKEDYDNSI